MFNILNLLLILAAGSFAQERQPKTLLGGSTPQIIQTITVDRPNYAPNHPYNTNRPVYTSSSLPAYPYNSNRPYSQQFVPSLPNKIPNYYGRPPLTWSQASQFPSVLGQTSSGTPTWNTAHNPNNNGYTKIPLDNKGVEVVVGPLDRNQGQNPTFYLDEQGIPRRVTTTTTYRFGIRNPLYSTLKRAENAFNLLQQIRANAGSNILGSNVLGAPNSLGAFGGQNILGGNILGGQGAFGSPLKGALGLGHLLKLG